MASGPSATAMIGMPSWIGRAQGHLEVGTRPRPQPAEGPAARRRGARRGAPPARRPAAAARPPDRVPAPDPGRARPPVGRAPARARRGDAPRPGRGLGGRHLLRPLRPGARGRDAAPGRDRAGLRLALLRARRRRRRCSRRCATAPTRRRCGCVRAPCMGRCDVAPTAEVGHFHVDRATPAAVAAAIADGHVHPEIPAYEDLAAYAAAGGYGELRALREALAQLRRGDRGPARRRVARPGRRGLPRRAQVAARARRAGAALPRRQRRRGRARHLQGPPLPRAHAAPDARGHADRRLGRRGRALLHLHARRVPGGARDPAPRDRRARGGRARRARLRRAPPRRRRLHLRRGIGDARVDRGQARPAAAPAALRRAGRAVRPADAGPQRRDAALGGADLPRGAGGACRARGERPARACAASRSPGGWRGPGVYLLPAGSTVARPDRGGRRHGRGPCLQGLPARRAVVRAAARLARRRAARLRHAAAARHLHRLGGGGDPLRPGQRAGGGAQHAALLRGRELRPVHAVPGRLRQGRAADGGRALGPRASRRALPARWRTRASAASARRHRTRSSSRCRHFPDEI